MSTSASPIEAGLAGLSFQRSRSLWGIQSWDLDPARFALARIGLGLTMLLAYLHLQPTLLAIYGSEGLVATLAPHRYSWIQSHTYLAWSLVLVASVSYCIGFKTRLSAVALVWLHFSFGEVTRSHTWGWTTVAPAFIVYVAFIGGGDSHSIDAKLKKFPLQANKQSHDPVFWSRLFFRLLQVHLFCVYLTAAWSRLFAPGWHRGDMILVALEDSTFSRFTGIDWIPLALPLMVATWIGWFIELGAPFALLNRHSAKWWAIALIALHLSLELLATVAWWQFTMISVLTVFFPVEWHQAFWSRIPLRRSLSTPSLNP